VAKLFEKTYSVEVPKLRFGSNEESFVIDSSFFTEFEFSPIQEGNLKVVAKIDRSVTHLDTVFHFKGEIMIECDRCLEPYPYPLDFETRVVYSFDPELEFDTDEVVLIEESTPVLYFATDFYDFIVLQIPLRRVPEASVHLCAPNVLELLGLNPDGTEKPVSEVEAETEEDETDPRWLALKKLKDLEQ
jgi:uncharacterized protein